VSEALAVLRAGVCCPVGLDARETAASIRAGVTRKRESVLLDGRLEPVIMGHLADRYLPPLVPALRKRVRVSPLEPRLLRLGTRPLQEALANEYAAVEAPLYLATPRPLPDYPFLSAQFGAMLGVQAERKLALETSRTFAEGRTGLFAALLAARDELLAPGRAEFVLVGGVDSHLDDERIAELETAGRLRTTGPQDAFTPGEAAAFVVLATAQTCRRHGLAPQAWITAVELLAPTQPPRTTLATACAAVLGRLGDSDRVRLVMAGLNGESRSARAWGIARLRGRAHLADELRVEHPAEYVGDCGAALAPMMLVTATRYLRAGMAQGPALVWACADTDHAGALLLHPAT
jgi:3-oxoacyl-[acyl-carrier-protein] synthase-1